MFFAVLPIGLIIKEAEEGETLLQQAHIVAIVAAPKPIPKLPCLPGSNCRLRGGVRDAGGRQGVEVLEGADGLRRLLAVNAIHGIGQVAKLCKTCLHAFNLWPARTLEEFVGKGGKCER